MMGRFGRGRGSRGRRVRRNTTRRLGRAVQFAQEPLLLQLGHGLVQAQLDSPFIHHQPIQDPVIGEAV